MSLAKSPVGTSLPLPWCSYMSAHRVARKLASERQTDSNAPERTSLRRETFTGSDSSVTNSRAIKSQVSSRAIRGWSLSRRFLLRESCFQP